MNENNLLPESTPSVKALGPLGGIVPQEIVTGGIMRGYGPRRGNLERLLRYWRPIMRKPGGFTRCRVILANHPELYPLERICAWLHHETTGVWPNEGCHHPTMKNCRNKLKKLTKKNWTNLEFARHLRSGNISAPRQLSGIKSDDTDAPQDVFFHDFEAPSKDEMHIVTESDIKHAMDVLRDFNEMESTFCSWLRDSGNWEHEGQDSSGEMKTMDISQEKSLEQECCGENVY